MKFCELQENLRRLLWQRVLAGELTGLQLARESGFRQAHISNFLRQKRALSLQAMDQVLRSQHLSVLDLLDPKAVNQRSSLPPGGDYRFQNVFLVSAPVAACCPLIMRMNSKGVLKFEKRFLRGLRRALRGARADWERFVAIRLDRRESLPMFPRLLPGATVLLDRHYNALQPYRKGQPNLYAIRMADTCVIRQVELSRRNLVLRPANPLHPVELVPIEDRSTPADYLIGRVCHVGNPL